MNVHLQRIHKAKAQKAVLILKVYVGGGVRTLIDTPPTIVLW